MNTNIHEWRIFKIKIGIRVHSCSFVAKMERLNTHAEIAISGASCKFPIEFAAIQETAENVHLSLWNGAALAMTNEQSTMNNESASKIPPNRLLSLNSHLRHRRAELAMAFAAEIGSGLAPLVESEKAIQFVAANSLSQLLPRRHGESFGLAAQQIAMRGDHLREEA